jgi:pimeloyl-ACP methyl ester carboxylesterase
VAAWGACGQFVDPSGEMRQFMAHIIDAPIPPMHGLRDFLVRQYGEANALAMTHSLVAALSEIAEAHGGDISLARAGQINCPVLLITGEHDPFATPALVSALAARLPRVEQQVVPGAPHDVYRAQPDWLTEQLKAWLAAPAGASPTIK